MATTPTDTSPTSSRHRSGIRASRVARRTTSSPRANPYSNLTTNDNSSNRARHRAEARRWSWLPVALATWRHEEEIQLPTETGESSAMDISPYTQEPTHCTVPVLAARLHRHEKRLRDMNLELQETRENWRLTAQERIAQVYEDQENLIDNMDVVHDQLVETRDEVATLRLRLEQCELRSREAEEHARLLEQRLTLAEENARMAGRLAETMERVITLIAPPEPNQD